MAGLRTLILLGLAVVTMGAAPARICEPLRVMSYNIRLDLESDGINRWANRRDQFIGQIRLMQPAILGLQEVVPGQKSDLEKALPGYDFLGVARDDGRSKGEFSNLAIRRDIFRVRSSGTFWLSPTPSVPSKGWDAAYPRIATWAKLVRRSDGRRFLVLNTHFDHVGETARLQSARQIAGWLLAHRKPGETVIITGDLNTEPGTPPIRELTHSTLGLQDTHEASQTPPIGPDGTFNNFVMVPSESRRIDYILATPSLAVENYAVLAWQGKGGRPASDHFPVIADLSACEK
jgi:endonuclease/exonuclease/phosphatase family metal-dependent hydrolase